METRGSGRASKQTKNTSGFLKLTKKEIIIMRDKDFSGCFNRRFDEFVPLGSVCSTINQGYWPVNKDSLRKNYCFVWNRADFFKYRLYFYFCPLIRLRRNPRPTQFAPFRCAPFSLFMQTFLSSPTTFFHNEPPQNFSNVYFTSCVSGNQLEINIDILYINEQWVNMQPILTHNYHQGP